MPADRLLRSSLVEGAHLARAAHSGPTIVVTLLAGLLARGFGADVGLALLVVAAVFTGQLTIGWSNDLIDADRDRRVGRTDKPMATGALRPRTVVVAMGLALVMTVVLSILLGLAAGAVHLVGVVAMGWAYNLGLKSSVLSPLPYAVAFGILPSVASLAVVGQWAPWWLAVAGAGTGVAAHFANVLPDLGDDAATGVRGLPHRLGERGARIGAAVVLAAVVATALVGAGLPAVLVVVAVIASVSSLVLLLVGPPRLALPAIMVLAAVIVAVAGGRISG